MDFSLVATAFAQAADGAAQKGPSIFEMLALPIGFLVIMYFFIIRPQQRRAKDHSSLLSGLKAGDEVFTNGGIIGRVRSVADTFVSLEVAGNVNIKVLRTHIGGKTKSDSKPAEKSS